MDINDLRAGVTVLTFLVFVGIVWWAYSDRRKPAYDEAAMIPFDDDLLPGSANARQLERDTERKSS